MTFSQHAAQYPGARRYFAVLLSSMTTFFLWYLVFLMPQKFDLPVTFIVLAILISVGVFVAGIVPETTGWRVKVHRIAAFGFATLMVPLVAVLAVFLPGTLAVRVILGLLALYLANDVWILAKNKGEHPDMLLRQAIYLGVFAVAIMTATFFGRT